MSTVKQNRWQTSDEAVSRWQVAGSAI
jgi:hypothetical protein